MRGWYQQKTPEERRAHIARRDPELVAAREAARSLTAEKIASVKRSQLRHPERHRARMAAHSATQSGRLVRQPCFCGVTRAEGHHPDYSRPLEVEWLCRRHHVERHTADGR